MPTPTFDSDVYTEENQYKDDGKLLVQFFMTPVKNEVKSAQEGRPIFDEKPMVRIMVPGSKDVTVQRATEQYQLRFPKQWERFQKHQEQVADGTPLDQVPFLTVGQIAELKALNVFTLEGLAGMPDSTAHRFMGFNQMRDKARAFLEAARGLAPITQLQAQLDEMKNQNQVLARQVEELTAAAKAAAAKK